MLDIVTALAELGATRSTLTPAQSDQLDEFGYLPLPGILDDVTLEAPGFAATNCLHQKPTGLASKLIRGKAPLAWRTWSTRTGGSTGAGITPLSLPPWHKYWTGRS